MVLRLRQPSVSSETSGAPARKRYTGGTSRIGTNQYTAI